MNADKPVYRPRWITYLVAGVLWLLFLHAMYLIWSPWLRSL